MIRGYDTSALFREDLILRIHHLYTIDLCGVIHLHAFLLKSSLCSRTLAIYLLWQGIYLFGCPAWYLYPYPKSAANYPLSPRLQIPFLAVL